MQQSTGKHNPVTFYLRLLLYMCVALIMRLVALTPLAALFLFPKGSPWQWLAALCPVMLVFLILPLRFSFAEALVQKSRIRYFSFDAALSMKGYGEKLLESLLHAVNLLKWALPLIAMGAYAYYCKDSIDAKTVMMSLIQTGKTASDAVYSVTSFFSTLFGHIPAPQVAGGLMQGVYVYGGVLGLGVIVLLIGAVRNSATRYIWVLAEREERPVRTEVRRRLRGRRWRQLGVGLINLALWSPCLAVVGLTLKDVLGDLSTQLMMMLASGGKGAGLDVTQAILPLLEAFALLYLPLLPARRIITATFATRNVRHTVPKQPAAKPAGDEAPAQELGYVPDWVKETNSAAQAAAAPPIAPSFADVEAAPVTAAAQPQAQPVSVPAVEPAVWSEAAPAGEPVPEPVWEQTEEAPASQPDIPADQPAYGYAAQPEAPVSTDQPAPIPEETPAAPAVDENGWAEETLGDGGKPGLGA